MAKNIKITPDDGLFEFSGSNASNINLQYDGTNESLAFSGANDIFLVQPDGQSGFEISSDATINIGGDGELNWKGLQTGGISKGGIWKGVPSDFKGIKGVKGGTGDAAPNADDGPKGIKGQRGGIGTQGSSPI